MCLAADGGEGAPPTSTAERGQTNCGSQRRVLGIVRLSCAVRMRECKCNTRLSWCSTGARRRQTGPSSRPSSSAYPP